MSDPAAQEPGQKNADEHTGHDAQAGAPQQTAAAPAQGTPEKKKERKCFWKEKQTLVVTIAVALIIIAASLAAFVFLNPQETLKAEKGDTVTVYYTGTLDNGTVFDTNTNGTALVFTIGNSSIIPGFEEAVTGMSSNEVKTVTLPPAKAYGNHNPALVQTVNRTGPLENVTLVAGQHYVIHNKATDTYSRVTIVNVTPTNVTIDANNPLSGQNLTFAIKLAEISRPVPNNTSSLS